MLFFNRYRSIIYCDVDENRIQQGMQELKSGLISTKDELRSILQNWTKNKEKKPSQVLSQLLSETTVLLENMQRFPIEKRLSPLTYTLLTGKGTHVLAPADQGSPLDVVGQKSYLDLLVTEPMIQPLFGITYNGKISHGEDPNSPITPIIFKDFANEFRGRKDVVIDREQSILHLFDYKFEKCNASGSDDTSNPNDDREISFFKLRKDFRYADGSKITHFDIENQISRVLLTDVADEITNAVIFMSLNAERYNGQQKSQLTLGSANYGGVYNWGNLFLVSSLSGGIERNFLINKNTNESDDVLIFSCMKGYTASPRSPAANREKILREAKLRLSSPTDLEFTLLPHFFSPVPVMYVLNEVFLLNYLEKLGLDNTDYSLALDQKISPTDLKKYSKNAVNTTIFATIATTLDSALFSATKMSIANYAIRYNSFVLQDEEGEKAFDKESNRAYLANNARKVQIEIRDIFENTLKDSWKNFKLVSTGEVEDMVNRINFITPFWESIENFTQSSVRNFINYLEEEKIDEIDQLILLLIIVSLSQSTTVSKAKEFNLPFFIKTFVDNKIEIMETKKRNFSPEKNNRFEAFKVLFTDLVNINGTELNFNILFNLLEEDFSVKETEKNYDELKKSTANLFSPTDLQKSVTDVLLLRDIFKISRSTAKSNKMDKFVKIIFSYPALRCFTLHNVIFHTKKVKNMIENFELLEELSDNLTITEEESRSGKTSLETLNFQIKILETIFNVKGKVNKPLDKQGKFANNKDICHLTKYLDTLVNYLFNHSADKEILTISQRDIEKQASHVETRTDKFSQNRYVYDNLIPYITSSDSTDAFKFLLHLNTYIIFQNKNIGYNLKELKELPEKNSFFETLFSPKIRSTSKFGLLAEPLEEKKHKFYISILLRYATGAFVVHQRRDPATNQTLPGLFFIPNLFYPFRNSGGLTDPKKRSPADYIWLLEDQNPEGIIAEFRNPATVNSSRVVINPYYSQLERYQQSKIRDFIQLIYEKTGHVFNGIPTSEISNRFFIYSHSVWKANFQTERENILNPNQGFDWSELGKKGRELAQKEDFQQEKIDNFRKDVKEQDFNLKKFVDQEKDLAIGIPRQYYKSLLEHQAVLRAWKVYDLEIRLQMLEDNSSLDESYDFTSSWRKKFTPNMKDNPYFNLERLFGQYSFPNLLDDIKKGVILSKDRYLESYKKGMNDIFYPATVSLRDTDIERDILPLFPTHVQTGLRVVNNSGSILFNGFIGETTLVQQRQRKYYSDSKIIVETIKKSFFGLFEKKEEKTFLYGDIFYPTPFSNIGELTLNGCFRVQTFFPKKIEKLNLYNYERLNRSFVDMFCAIHDRESIKALVEHFNQGFETDKPSLAKLNYFTLNSLTTNIIFHVYTKDLEKYSTDKLRGLLPITGSITLKKVEEEIKKGKRVRVLSLDSQKALRRGYLSVLNNPNLKKIMRDPRLFSVMYTQTNPQTFNYYENVLEKLTDQRGGSMINEIVMCQDSMFTNASCSTLQIPALITSSTVRNRFTNRNFPDFNNVSEADKEILTDLNFEDQKAFLRNFIATLSEDSVKIKTGSISAMNNYVPLTLGNRMFGNEYVLKNNNRADKTPALNPLSEFFVAISKYTVYAVSDWINFFATSGESSSGMEMFQATDFVPVEIIELLKQCSLDKKHPATSEDVVAIYFIIRMIWSLGYGTHPSLYIELQRMLDSLELLEKIDSGQSITFSSYGMTMTLKRDTSNEPENAMVDCYNYTKKLLRIILSGDFTPTKLTLDFLDAHQVKHNKGELTIVYYEGFEKIAWYKEQYEKFSKKKAINPKFEFEIKAALENSPNVGKKIEKKIKIVSMPTHLLGMKSSSDRMYVSQIFAGCEFTHQKKLTFAAIGVESLTYHLHAFFKNFLKDD